ncbi:hypothetical protein [Thermomonospora umbrina]|uniref:Uncharacterized protein n=1 Tax=Thermomonospora umbrina TaxID=111806 RepID=A0A3D9SVK1_9ACTN|nr:hypothetical protein [Thermomonospora umbrina]REE99989.1 hypothetical protein DFJ69_5510 [Thermomonospora umbrina]
MAGFLKKVLGGESKQELDSCCGSVSVVPEDEVTETETAQERAEAKPVEPGARADR